MKTAHGRAIENGEAGGHERRAVSSDRADLSLICRVHRRLCALPPLLSAVSRDLVSGLGVLDESLLLVLQGGHMLSDDIWESLALVGSAA